MNKLLLLMALVLPFLFTSCGDEKDVLSYQEKLLVGEWAIVNTPGAQADDFHYVFNKERTGSRRHLIDGSVVSSVSFYWTLNGDVLTLDYDGDRQLVMKISINNDKMHVVYVETGATEDYKKVEDSEQ